MKIIKENTFSLGRNEKLIHNLIKTKQRLPYKNLKTLFRARIKIQKLYKVIEFKQTAFLKPYIKDSTRLQKLAEKKCNRIKKQNSKLRNNVTFIKIIEAPINIFYVKIITSTTN